MKNIVLLASARPDVLESVPVTLKLAGFTALVAQSGLDTIRQARSHGPDIVLLDAQLPDMDGATVVDILHRLPSTASIPTMLLQASAPASADPAGSTANRADLLLQVAQVLVFFKELTVRQQAAVEWDLEPIAI